MAEQILPKFPSTLMSLGMVTVCCKGGTVVYFIGLVPFFTHPESDIDSFKLACCLLYHHDHASQVEIADFFGVSVRGIKRACKRFKTTGAGNFNKKETPQRRSSTIFTDDFIDTVQLAFDEGKDKKEVANMYNLKMDTLNRAIRDGRIEVKKKT